MMATARGGWPGASWRACGGVVCLLLAAAAPSAQVAGTTDAPLDRDEQEVRRHDRRLYVGMWTSHLKDEVLVIDSNWAVGVTARGYFGATFLNSFGRRGFAGGVQRTLAGGPGGSGVSLGLRLGFITGYDGRLMPLARKAPVLPLVQPLVTLDVGRIGVEVSYTFVVVSAATSWRF
jgi:hypothetical protein